MNKQYLTNLRQQIEDAGLIETLKAFDMEMNKLDYDIRPNKKYRTCWTVRSLTHLYGTYSTREAAYKTMIKICEESNWEYGLHELRDLKNQYKEKSENESFGIGGWLWAEPVEMER